ncbi:MAG: WD40/YVTN/BNR-like repeat-containing protein, partial [Candidatus Acidiferrales bacterium]
MKYRSIGPFRGGRVLAVTGIAGNPNVYYFGAVAGGVWKTTDGGLTWDPIFDKEPVSSIGAIEVAPSDPNIIYVGTGEGCLRGNISYGNGMYKSVDAGATWTHIGLDDTQHIARIAVDPHNPEIVFVAAVGHAYGPNAERGVFRTTDGGKSWSKVLSKDDKTGAVDLSFDPTNSHIIYAALYQFVRLPWGMESGGPGSGIYKSIDGGTTWSHLEAHGLPEGIYGRIGIAVSGADPDRVYALIEAKEGGLYRSNDAGAKWEKINDDHRFRQRAWYFTHIFADPKNADTVYILNTGAFRSNDGGKSFSLLHAPHGDHHGLW